MKYKVLLNGKAAQVTDFIKYTSDSFMCLSTSSYIKDIANHFQVFEPDIYVAFLDLSEKEAITSINSLKDYPSYNSAPIVVVGNNETCETLQKTYPHLADMFVKRPISADNLALKIIRFLEKLQSEQAPQADAAASEEKTDANAKKHILLVDDDRSILKMLKTALSEFYEVTTMVNGMLVEKFLETKHVDLILLDHEMPIETGAEVFKKLKNHPKGKNVPVCFLTGVSDREKIMEIMRLKPHGYLLKPINMDMLLSTISNLIE